jgi:hypothetical protein
VARARDFWHPVDALAFRLRCSGGINK